MLIVFGVSCFLLGIFVAFGALGLIAMIVLRRNPMLGTLLGRSRRSGDPAVFPAAGGWR